MSFLLSQPSMAIEAQEREVVRDGGGLRTVSYKSSFLCPQVTQEGTVSIPLPRPDSRGPYLAWASPGADGNLHELRLLPL